MVRVLRLVLVLLLLVLVKPSLISAQEATPVETSTPSAEPTTSPSSEPTATPAPTGDVNHDGIVNITDYELVLQSLGTNNVDSDLDQNGVVDIFDLNFVIDKLASVATPKPSIPPGAPITSGFWITPSEIMALPTSGPAWDSVKHYADLDAGQANLADQDSYHPEDTLAIALVAVRTGDQSYIDRAVNELMEAIGTENNTDPNCDYTRSIEDGGPAGARSLALGRNLAPYAVAADILNFRSGGYNPDGKGAQFESWISAIRFRENCPHVGRGTYPEGDWANIIESHEGSVSNVNTMEGGARVAIDAYVGDTSDIEKVWKVFRQYVGDTTLNGFPGGYNSFSQTWYSVPNPVIGVNPVGATCNNGPFPADGAIPNDQGRGGPCPTNINTAPTYTQYPWEGMQGAYVQALSLQRLGYEAWNLSDKALLRTVEYQKYLQDTFGGSWWDPTRANWVKHLTNKAYGTNFEVNLPDRFRNMGYTTWTHQ